MVAVNTVAKANQPTDGNPARDAVLSTRFASLTNATLVATKPAADKVLTAKLCRLKNKRLQPPIMNTFQPHNASAFVRAALGAARNNR